MQIELIFPYCWCKFDYSELLSKIDPKMRRYNSLNNSREDDSRDEADGSGGATLISDSGGGGRRLNNEEETPFTDYPVDEHARYKRTFCLVFTLFIGGLVSSFCCFFAIILRFVAGVKTLLGLISSAQLNSDSDDACDELTHNSYHTSSLSSPADLGRLIAYSLGPSGFGSLC